jgi:SRSO17 transposase
MAQGARRSAMSSTQIRQVAKQAQMWADGLAELHERIRPRFGRIEPRRRALGYLRGLLGALERKNSWWLAEQAGELTPDGMQRLLNGAGWDADGVRDDLREYVVEHLGDPAAVLVLDETGFLKKGTHSAGVARQYTSTAGRIENAQVGVFLAYATLAGVALIDRDLYLPKVWTDDRERCRAAGIGDQVAFQTKPQLAQALLQRTVETKVPFRWVTGDSVYGGDRRLRVWLEQHAIPHVLAVKCTEPLLTMTDRGPGQVPAEQLLAQVEPEQWLRLSAGEGSKGRRLYDWVRVPLWRWGWPANVGFWLLARRSISDPTDLAFYVCFAPAATSLATLVQVAGCRWRVEEAFEQARARSGWTTTRSASTAPGTGTSLSRWPRTPS